MSKISVELTEEDELQSAEERRRSERSQLIVRIDYATVDEVFSEFTRDINEGGLFIETEKPRPLGTEVSLQFNLPGDTDIVRTIGRVVRINTGSSESPPGMGIEFDDLAQEARAQIDILIRALRTGPPSGEEQE